MIDKHAIPTKLFWVDLEMTGLDAQKDVILEVAAEVTDFKFNTLATYEARIKHPRHIVAQRMQANVWWKEYPENRDQFLDNIEKGLPLADAEKELCQFLDEHFGKEPAVLSGNSIHNDRIFIKRWMPALDLKLHYRMLDVSSWKVFMQGRFGVVYEKQEVHRAFDDIQASVAELEYYLDWFKSQPEA